MAHRCMMEAVENSTSRKSQIGQSGSGRGQSESVTEEEYQMLFYQTVYSGLKFFFLFHRELDPAFQERWMVRDYTGVCFSV